MPKAVKWRQKLNQCIMAYNLNFPNGNVQTYNSLWDLEKAARSMGGETKMINSNTYVFVPKK